MTSIKINIAQALLMAFLVIFGLELASVSFINQLQDNLKVSELPFDTEEEEEKSEKEKEFDDKLFRSESYSTSSASAFSHYFIHSSSYRCIPREIVTPPPELQS